MIYILALDIFIAALLLTTIVMCFKLNTRIRILQDGKSELRKLIDQFNEASAKASQNITDIHEATRKSVDSLQMKINKAQFLADDISFMIEKGNKLADKLESDISDSRKVETLPVRGSNAAKKERAAAAGQHKQRSKPPQEKALETVGAEASPAPKKEQGSHSRSVESVLEKISGRKPSSSGASSKPVVTARPRSQAEKELLQALRSNR